MTKIRLALSLLLLLLSGCAGPNHFSVGQKHYDAAEYKQAEEAYTRAIESGHRTSATYYNRGLARRNLGKLDAAAGDFSSYIRLNPEKYDGYMQRAKTYSLAGLHDRAIADLDRAVSLEGGEATVYAVRAAAHARRGENRDAVRDYDRCIDLSPDYHYCYQQRAHARKLLNDYDGAIRDYEKSIELAPDEPAYRINYVVALADMGKRNEAVGYARRYENTSPGPLAQIALSVALGRSKEYGEACQSIRLAIDGLADPSGERLGSTILAGLMTFVYLERARCSAELGRFEDATASLERAQFHSDSCPECGHEIGVRVVSARIAYLRGDLEEAIRTLDAVFEHTSDEWKRSNWGAEAYFVHANALLKNGKPERARQSYLRFIERNDSDPEAFANLALASVQLRRDDEALESYTRALSLDPLLRTARIGRASVYMNAGRYRDALSDLEAAFAIEAPAASELEMSGYARLALGDCRRAAAAARRALALSPESAAAADILRRCE